MSLINDLLPIYSGKERTKVIDFLTNLTTKNANGNYSGTSSTIFSIAPSLSTHRSVPDDVYLIQKLIVTIEDSAVNADQYGALASLTNGIIFRVSNSSGVKFLITDAVPVKILADYGRLGKLQTMVGSAVSACIVEIDFTEMDQFDGGIILDSAKGEKLEAVLNDDFTGLVTHYFTIQGEKLVNSNFIFNKTTTTTTSTTTVTTTSTTTVTTTSTTTVTTTTTETTTTTVTTTLLEGSVGAYDNPATTTTTTTSTTSTTSTTTL